MGYNEMSIKMSKLEMTKYINRTEQNIYFIDVNCTVSCQIHEYNNKFTNGHNICIHDLTTKS